MELRGSVMAARRGVWSSELELMLFCEHLMFPVPYGSHLVGRERHAWN
jgi:hypothetical protein